MLPQPRRRVALLTALLGAACSAPAGPPGDPSCDSADLPAAVAPAVDLALMADTLERLMPAAASDGYRQPDSAARVAFARAARCIEGGALRAAAELVAPWGYLVSELRETTAASRRLFVLRERAPVTRGWGTYVFDPAASIAADVHTNHPISDARTTHLSARLYRGGRYRWWLVAGAHRAAAANGTSDMARSDSSIFQAIHREVGDDARTSLSIHGFARANHLAPIDTSDVVLSEGMPEAPTAGAVALRDALRASPFRTLLYGVDDEAAALGGTRNPQGRWSNATRGRGRWVHVELAAELRHDGMSESRLREVLAAWTAARP